MTQPHCKRCGKPLSDPVSVRMGMGPECRGVGGRRGGFSKGQRHQNARVERSLAFGKGEPLSVGELEYHKNGEKWVDNNGHETDDEVMKAWLLTNRLIFEQPERRRVYLWEIHLKMLGSWYNVARYTGTKAEFAAYWREYYYDKRARARMVKE